MYVRPHKKFTCTYVENPLDARIHAVKTPTTCTSTHVVKPLHNETTYVVNLINIRVGVDMK